MPKRANFSAERRGVLLPGVAVLMLVSACAPQQDTLRSEAIGGRVLEQGTERPISDVTVVAQWVGDLPGAADSQTVCYHVLSTKSNTQGAFRFPAWEKKAIDWQRRVKAKHVYLTAYKDDYEFVVTTVDRKVYLKGFSGSREERLKYLKRVDSTTNCRSADQSERNLLDLRKAIYEEARAIAKTRDDGKTVESLLFGLEIVQFGYELAEKRHLERIGREK